MDIIYNLILRPERIDYYKHIYPEIDPKTIYDVRMIRIVKNVKFAVINDQPYPLNDFFHSSINLN